VWQTYSLALGSDKNIFKTGLNLQIGEKNECENHFSRIAYLPEKIWEMEKIVSMF